MVLNPFTTQNIGNLITMLQKKGIGKTGLGLDCIVVEISKNVLEMDIKKGRK